MLKYEGSGLHFGTNLGAKFAPGGPGTLLGAKWAPGAFPGGSRDASAVPKNSMLSSGGPPEKFPSEISPSQGVPGSALGPILGALGAHFGPPFGDRRSKCENLNFC